MILLRIGDPDPIPPFGSQPHSRVRLNRVSPQIRRATRPFPKLLHFCPGARWIRGGCNVA